MKNKSTIECALLSHRDQFFLTPLLSLWHIIIKEEKSFSSLSATIGRINWQTCLLPVVAMDLGCLPAPSVANIAIFRTFFKHYPSLSAVAVMCEGKFIRVKLHASDLQWVDNNKQLAWLKNPVFNGEVTLLDPVFFSKKIEEFLLSVHYSH